MAVAKRETKSKKTSSAQPQQELRITLVRSIIGRSRYQREVVKGLGLRKLNSQVVRRDTPEIRGMIQKIHHLVEVEAVKTK
jgi:large subunit ribosomal protein L30